MDGRAGRLNEALLLVRSMNSTPDFIGEAEMAQMTALGLDEKEAFSLLDRKDDALLSVSGALLFFVFFCRISALAAGL